MVENNQKLFNFPEYGRVLKRRKFYFLIPLLVFPSVVYWLSYFIKPTYESSTTLMIKDDEFVSRNMETILPGVTRRQQEAKVIKSKVMSRINMLELINQMKFKEETDIQNDARTKQQKYPGYSLDEIMDEMLLEILGKLISVENIGSEYIKISTQHHNPGRAFEMAERLANIFIENSLKTQLGGLEGVEEFGNEQIAIYKKQVEDAEYRLKKYEDKLQKKSIENYNITSINLNDLNSERLRIQMQLDDSQEKLTTFKRQSSEAVTSLSLVQSPYLDRLVEKLMQRATEHAQLLVQFDWNDPKVSGLANEMVGIKGEIGQSMFQFASKNLTNEKDTENFVKIHLTELDVKVFTEEKQQLEKKLREYKTVAANDPANDLVRRRLQEELDSYREIYKMILQQHSGSQIQKALKQSSARFLFEVVEPAFRPMKPSKPNRTKMLIIGLALGLAIGLGTVFILEYTNDTFKDIGDIEEYLGLIVLGTLPKIELKRNEVGWKNYLNLKLVISICLLMGSCVALIFGLY